MNQSRLLPILAAVIAGLVVVGFLRGTDKSDYDLALPSTVGQEATDGSAEVAGRYADARHATTSDGSATASRCEDCHEERVTTAARGRRTEHPVGVVVPQGARLAELLASGGRLQQEVEDGPRTVVCRSCHRPHNASEDARLIVTADEGALCVSCHADHRAARSQHPVQVSLSPAKRAAIEGIGGVAGTALSCLSCHDPHASTAGTLLRTDAAGADACRVCHAAQASALGEAGHGAQSCVACHGMHRAPPEVGKGPAAPELQDQRCMDCHAAKGSKRLIRLTGGHPMGVDVPASAEGHEGKVSCSHCHQAHSSRPNVLVRAKAGELCVECHPAQASVLGTDHDGSLAPVAGSRSGCVTCHDIHGSSARPAPPTGVNPASGRCLACHDGRTDAKTVAAWSHPGDLLLTSTGLPNRYKGPVSYFGPDGLPTEDTGIGEIACQTCHDPHRWKAGEGPAPGAVEGTEQNSFLRNQKEVIRLCSVCHDTDGRPRFRFFHGDQLRATEDAP